MKNMKNFYRTMVAILATLFVSATALAQSTILVVDQGKVLRDSEVGKHIERQLDSIAKTMQSEIKTATAPLQSEGERLKAEVEALGQVDFTARPDLKSRLESLAGKSQKQQYEAAMKQQELKKTELVAYGKVNEALRGILQQIVTERNADIVIDRSLVIYGKPADVTDTVLARLNAQMKTVPVVRERLPRQ